MRELRPRYQLVVGQRARALAHAARRTFRPAWLRQNMIQPLDTFYGYRRGTPVDRHYIDHFFATHRDAIHGHCLEIKDTSYTDAFGTGVTRADILDIDRKNPRATIIADLTAADGIKSNTFDCFIVTQTLHLIFDIRAALGHAYRIVKPGGVLLITVPATSRVVVEADPRHDYWRFTTGGLDRLLDEWCTPAERNVQSFGNVYACSAFLYGAACEELNTHKLNVNDDNFPLIIAACIRKS